MTSMKLAIQSLGSFILTMLLCGQVFSQGSCFPEKNENRLVYDEANLLSADEVNNLEDSLRALAQSTGNQIVIVIVEDLCD
ncbi:MAG: TPM domain-containing protein, partial [Bacteroidetes bacterium]|nr:TPM domain-containing protein [Bacteroidota bacterium]